MSRVKLTFLQVMVAVVSVGIWYGFTTYPVFGRMLLPPFFFSNPVEVIKHIYVWFATGVIL
jgi:NitT/TauT family transport system permease protein